MDLALTKQLLDSNDAARMQSVGRDLGRHLAARADDLLEFRRLIARQRGTATSEHRRGFLEALELVATGFERHRTEVSEGEAELAAITSRARWVDAMRVIADGVVRPGDLAARLEVTAGRASQLVKELETAELIVIARDAHDLRARVCRLTPRGLALLDRIPPATPAREERAVDEAVAEIVPAVVACLGTLTRDRRLSRTRMTTMLRGAVEERLAARVVELLGRSFDTTAMAVLGTDDAWAATEDALHTRLQMHLSLACQARKSSVIEWLSTMSQDNDVILRVAGGLLEWESAVRALARVHVIRADVFQFDEPLEVSPEATIVYESASLLRADETQRFLQPEIRKARGRYYLSIDGGYPIPDFNAVAVEMPEIEA